MKITNKWKMFEIRISLRNADDIQSNSLQMTRYTFTDNEILCPLEFAIDKPSTHCIAARFVCRMSLCPGQYSPLSNDAHFFTLTI